MNKDIVLLELFSGIGGFTEGFLRAGYNLKKHYFSEVDKHAIANYKYNYKKSEYVGSVTDVRGIGIEHPDIITFGSPCQDFSIAGNQLGMGGERSVLILEAIRLIRECKPSVFIWENVKGAFSSNSGADFWGIITAFANIGGYRLEWQLLNTSWFLPQNRERIYLIGHLAGRSEPGVFPITKNDRLFDDSEGSIKRRSQTENSSTIGIGFGTKADNTFIGDPKVAGCLTGGGHSGGLHSDMTTIGIKQINDKQNFGKSTKQQDRVYDSSGIMACIPSSRTENKLNIQVKSNTEKGFDEVHKGDSINFSQPNSKTRRGRVGSGVAQTLDTQCNQAVLTNNIRRLTEIECERLQGFLDNHTQYGQYISKSVTKYLYARNKNWRTEQALRKLEVFAINNTKLVKKEIPKTQRYKQCGNAVTVDVVEEIASRLKLI